VPKLYHDERPVHAGDEQADGKYGLAFDLGQGPLTLPHISS
jgi:hypothetical protein